MHSCEDNRKYTKILNKRIQRKGPLQLCFWSNAFGYHVEKGSLDGDASFFLFFFPLRLAAPQSYLLAGMIPSQTIPDLASISVAS
jgi:hypothetical protein